MKRFIILFFLLASANAHAAVMHDMSESKEGWSFNYANSARVKEKILLNIYIAKCNLSHPSDDCAHDQREARDMAHSKIKEQEKKMKKPPAKPPVTGE